MELQFQKAATPYLDRVIWESQSQELTQELRLGDGVGDIGKVLNAWGQVILRSKQWRKDCVSITGGISVWVVYLPEGEAVPQCADCWIPFQLKWNLPDTDREGIMRINCRLHYLDARILTPRKVMIRSGVGALLEAMVEQEAEFYTPVDLPEDVQLLKQKHILELSCEAGEKAFSLEEELPMPSGTPAPDKIFYYNVYPQVNETQLNGDKLVFRGNAPVHIGYLDGEGKLHAVTLDMDFSQLIPLKKEYLSTAVADVIMAVNHLEVDHMDGLWIVQCGLVGQYTVTDQACVETLEDGYSTCRSMEIQKKNVALPVYNREQSIPIPFTVELEGQGNGIVDSWILSEQPLVYREENSLRVESVGQCTVLYYDEDGKLSCSSSRWESQAQVPIEENQGFKLLGSWDIQGNVVSDSGGFRLKGEPAISMQTSRRQELSMISGLELGEEIRNRKKDPGLIIRRAGNGTLWELAKESASSVDSIRKANHLEGEPHSGQWLLIPIN